MLLECLACVHVLIIMVVKVSKGTVVLTVTSDGALVKGEPGTILCHVYPFEAAVSWKTSAYQSGGVDKDQSTCILSGDCFPPISLDDARYSFAAIVGNGQFNGTMTISNVECSTDSSRYTCTHSNTANEKEVITSTVQVIPTDLTISESDLTITAKTDCMAESSNLEIQWFKLYDDSAEEEYNVTDIQKSDNSSRCPADGCGTTEVTYSYVHTNPPEPTMEVKFKVKVWHSSRPSEFISRITNKKYKFPEQECCCCCICCFIVLIVSVALGILFTGGHIGLTWADHEYSVKKILSENNKTNKVTEAVCLKDYGIKAVLPKCCICVVVIIVQIAVYFAALKKDCNEHCDDCCGVFICLVVTIIVSVVKDATESGIIYLVVHVKGRNYIHQGQSVATDNRKKNPNDMELSTNRNDQDEH